MEFVGQTLRCSCGGAWIPDDVLSGMAEQMKGGFVELPWRARAGETVRTCIVCDAPMLTVTLAGIALDRCADEHGIWFDANELGAVLQKAGDFPAGALPEDRFPTGEPNPFNAIPGPDVPHEPIRNAGSMAREAGRLGDMLVGDPYQHTDFHQNNGLLGALFDVVKR